MDMDIVIDHSCILQRMGFFLCQKAISGAVSVCDCSGRNGSICFHCPQAPSAGFIQQSSNVIMDECLLFP